MSKIISLAIPLFILMDFIGTIPVFLALTQAWQQRERIRIAIAASLLAGAIVLVFAVSGRQILNYFALSVEAARVGGGLLLLYIAFEMILSGKMVYMGTANLSARNLIVSPLAIPMLAGPGSMTFAMIAFLGLEGIEKAYLFVAIVLAVLFGAGLLSLSSLVHKFLGPEFARGLEKITAVVISFVALEMIMSGIKTFFFSGGQ